MTKESHTRNAIQVLRDEDCLFILAICVSISSRIGDRLQRIPKQRSGVSSFPPMKNQTF